MTHVSGAQESLLDELMSLDVRAAVARLHAAGDAGALLLDVCDRAERLIIADLGSAMNVTERLVRLCDAVGVPAPRIRVRRIRSQAMAYSNNFTGALELLGEATAIGRDAGVPLETAKARLTAMHALARLGRLAEAVAEGEAARAAFLERGEVAFAAKADANLGNTRRMMDDPRGALVHFDRAREVLGGEPLAAAQLDSNRAEALLDLHEFAAAEAAFESARAAFESAGVARAAAIVEGNLADLMMRQGRLHAALALFELARRHMGELDAPGDVARLEAEHAEVLAAVGMHSQAADALRAALSGLREHKLAWEAARAQAALGRVLIHLHRRQEAASALEAAATEFKALGHATGAARVDLLRADLLAHDRRFAEAVELATDARDSLRARPADLAAASLQLAVISASRGDLARAELDATAALRAADEMDLAPLRADVLQLIGRLRRAGGEHARAAQDLSRAVDEVERVRGTLQADRLRAAFLGGRASMYEECFSAHLDLGSDECVRAAFDIAERAKSRALLDDLHRGEQASGESRTAADAGDLLAELSSAKGELSALYARLDSALVSRQPLRDAAGWRDHVQRCEQRIETAEARLAAGGRLSRIFAKPISAARVTSMLTPSSALIQYFAESEWVSAIVLRPDGAAGVRRMAPLSSIRLVLERLGLQIGRAVARAALPRIRGAGPEGAIRELRKLHDMLIAPMQRDLAGADRLWILPYGDLHAVPFHALHDGEGYLIENRSLVQAPSASILAGLQDRVRRDSHRGHAVVVGLGEAEGEARRVADAIGPDRSVMLLGEAATRARVMAEASGARLLHIASHATFAPVAPLASGIRLADGWLTARDALSLDLGGAAVTLSACDTGRAVVGAGDEVLGLARGFLAAGAASVVMSLWPVHEKNTTEMMAKAYNEMYAEGREAQGGLAGPLRRAQREMLCRHPHPAAWAPFVMIGAS